MEHMQNQLNFDEVCFMVFDIKVFKVKLIVGFFNLIVTIIEG